MNAAVIEAPERRPGQHRSTYEARVRAWRELVGLDRGYAGYRTCACGRFAYCRGNTYESQRCVDCWVGGR